jgi:uncharacterized protein (DUF1501 family)
MRVTRRLFLRSTGAACAYVGLLPVDAILARSADPTAASFDVKRGKTLVVLFLRGGADGLNLVVPYGDPAYAKLRPTLALPPPGAGDQRVVDLDGFFGLHPRMSPLLPWFESNLMVAAHAVGYAGNTRSHFEEQDVWETGIVGNTIHSDGWVNRHLATSQGHGPLRAVAIGDALPRILQGKEAAVALRGLDDLALPSSPGLDERAVVAALEHAYCCDEKEVREEARELVERASSATLESLDLLRKVSSDTDRSRKGYPRTQIGQRLADVARLIKADVGLEVAEVDLGGWDTHQDQGRGAGGPFGNLVGQLSLALDAFAKDLEDRMDDVLVVTLTDFGRTAAENGTGGTDHGWANSLLLMGGAVRKARQSEPSPKKVVARWPGLLPDQLHQGRDLLHTTDFRDVLAEVVRVHLGNPSLEEVLPGRLFESPGLVG